VAANIGREWNISDKQ